MLPSILSVAGVGLFIENNRGSCFVVALQHRCVKLALQRCPDSHQSGLM